jgi:hypothetical protein
MQRSYQLTSDPVFYWMGSFFALLTTALPAVLGQVRFMPLGQTVVLSILWCWLFAVAIRAWGVGDCAALAGGLDGGADCADGGGSNPNRAGF